MPDSAFYKPESPRPLRVFLCHSSADKPIVRELYKRLRADGIDAWLDEENLMPGQDWTREIPKAVRASDVVVVCLSQTSVSKAGYVQKEIKFALDVADEQPEDTIFIIPLKLEECKVPDRLGRWQWVHYYEERGYERLMRALRLRASALDTNVMLPAIAPPPAGVSLGPVVNEKIDVVKRSGGVDVDGSIKVGGDIVGRDKIQSIYNFYTVPANVTHQAMKTSIRPFPLSRIVVCSADAGPKSQREKPDKAGHFFPGAVWVAAVRNTADRLSCRFVVLTTGHGMVNPDDVIEPYDVPIREHRSQVAEKWRQTIPQVLGSQFSLMVFYSGGCPRDLYISVLKPILHSQGVSLITFGRPYMVDIGKLERFVTLIMKGTSLDELKSILKRPDKLEFYPVAA